MDTAITDRPRGLASAAASVAVIMFLLDMVAIVLASGNGRIIPVWPATAVALAIILRAPADWRRGLFAAATIGCLTAAAAGFFASDVIVGGVSGGTLAYAAFTAAELAIVLWLFGRDFDWHAGIDTLPVFVRFALAAAIACLAAAALAAGFAALFGNAQADNFVTSFLADALGLMTITPLLLNLTAPGRRRGRRTTSQLEATLVMSATLLVAIALFAQPAAPLILVAPFLLLAGLRLRVRETVFLLLLVTLIGTIATANGFGPVAGTLIGNSRLLAIDLFVAATAALMLPVTAIVSERARLMQALADSERGFRRVAEASIAGIARFDAAGRLSFVNRRWGELTGLSPEQSADDGWLDVFQDDARTRAVAMPDAGRRGDPTVELLAFRRSGGPSGWLELSCDLEKDDDGAITGHLLRMVDVTARCRAELAAAASSTALRKTNRLLLMAEELADVGHWRMGRSRDDFDFSAQARVIVGVPNGATVRPQDLLAQLDPAGRSAFLRSVVRACNGAAAECETRTRLRRPDGTERHLVVRIQAERRDGVLCGLFGVISDVTQKVAAESALIAARDAAESAARAKSEFVATMSHEIRTPMSGVMGMIELLRGDPDSPERGEYLDAMKQSADLLMGVLDTVLDFSLVESGKLVLKPRDFDVEALAQAAVTMFANAASRKGLMLSVRFDSAVGSFAHGDPVRLQQVLSNLIANAVKFTDEGKIEVVVRSRPMRGRLGHWRVTVRDSGPGIPLTERRTLFQPFVQAQGVARKGGTGLGLAIARSLIAAMGGKMGLHSVPGAGSTFWFEIDLPVGSAAGVRAILPARLVATRPLDVLLAEDNAVNQLLVAAMLRKMGHAPTCVLNGRLAVEAAAERRFDCILMDMQMPELDGIAATRAIRSGAGPNAETPIVALTADAAPERRRFYDNAGLTEFMTKPLDSAELAALLAKFAGATRAVGRARDGRRALAEVPTDVALDPGRLDELRQALGPQRVRALLRILARELGARLPAIARCAHRGDLGELRAQAHSLKGAALNVGAEAVGSAAGALEAVAEPGLPDAIARLDRAAAATLAAIGEQAAARTVERWDPLESTCRHASLSIL